MSQPRSPSECTLKARWVFPVESPPVSGGSITISGERIVAVGDSAAGASAVDLGDVAVVPGLVNAHAHLEFSGLSAPLGRSGMALPDWIRQVIEFRQKRTDPPQVAVAVGMREAIETGTTAVGEIASADCSPPLPPPSSLDMTVFHESIGLADEAVDDHLRTAKTFLAESARARHYRAGLSPHAPYSVHTDLFTGLVEMSAARRVPVAMHLAESLEELQLLADHAGPFRDLLQERQVWNPAAIRRGSRPADYLQVMTRAHRALVIHGNYLDDDELSLLAAHPEKLALVYCPRTHAFFQHPPHPLPRLLAAGGSAAIGTDSRASNPDLNMWAELRRLAKTMPELSPRTILDLGTLAGARALGFHQEQGSLQAGKYANLAVVPLAGTGRGDPYEMLFASGATVSRTMVRGRWAQS